MRDSHAGQPGTPSTWGWALGAAGAHWAAVRAAGPLPEREAATGAAGPVSEVGMSGLKF